MAHFASGSHVGFYTFVHKKRSASRRKQFHLVPFRSIGRLINAAEPTVLSALHHALGVGVLR
jgi:hypothetical protein